MEPSEEAKQAAAFFYELLARYSFSPKKEHDMKLFGQMVRTVANVVTLPVAAARDVVTLVGAIDNDGKSHTLEHMEKIKDEAQEER